MVVGLTLGFSRNVSINFWTIGRINMSGVEKIIREIMVKAIMVTL